MVSRAAVAEALNRALSDLCDDNALVIADEDDTMARLVEAVLDVVVDGDVAAEPSDDEPTNDPYDPDPFDDPFYDENFDVDGDTVYELRPVD